MDQIFAANTTPYWNLMGNITGTKMNTILQDPKNNNFTSNLTKTTESWNLERRFGTLSQIYFYVKAYVFYYGVFTVGSVGVFANVLLMLSMTASPKLLKNSGGMLIFALAFSDLSVNVTNIVFGYDYRHRFIKNYTYCVFYQYYKRTVRCVSHFITMLISINRFALVCYPFSHKKVTSKTATLFQLLAFIIFSGAACVYTFYLFDPNADKCRLGKDRTTLITFYIGVVVVDSVSSNIVPVIITMVLTYRVIRSLRKKKEALGQGVQRPTTSDQPVKTLTKAQQAENNLTNAMIAVNIAFVVIVLPFIIVHAIEFIYLLVDDLFGDFFFQIEIAYHMFYLFEQINYVINPFLYALYGPAFRASLVKLFMCGCCRQMYNNKRNVTTIQEKPLSTISCNKNGNEA